MTGTFGGRGRFSMDFDSHKNQEWLRRRKLRLEQVRKQSNEIARVLRQKVISDEKIRLDEYDRMSEANFKDWKAEKLGELEWRLRSALEEFGEGYKLAEEEPDAEKILEEKNKINFLNAQKRGEIAQQEAQKVKKMVEEKKMSPIQRKKMTRKKEDLRSALVRSVPAKKNLLDAQEVEKEILNPEKVSFSGVTKKVIKKVKDVNACDIKKKCVKSKKKNGKVHKSCLCKHKTPTKNEQPRNSETVWVNLDEIQSSTGELGLNKRSVESFVSGNRKVKERPEGTVEFYDFSSRFHCRSYREFPYLVERINVEQTEPNATELCKMEEENIKVETRKKEEDDLLVQERGMEALRREKIGRHYNNLITKLDELQRKEKVLKAQQRNQPSFFHMTDERLSQRLRTRQRIMDAKFENIYFGATSQIPEMDSVNPLEIPHQQGGGDWAKLDAQPSTSLSLSPSNLKPNTPVVSDLETSADSSPPEVIRRPKETKKKRQLLRDIERTLKEGRELRQTVSRNWDLELLEEISESQKEKLSSLSEEEKDRTVETSPVSEVKPQPATKTQECQTENVESERNILEIDVSLPVSTSTCYRSPPSVIRSHRFQQFLDCLEGVNEHEDYGLDEDKQALKKKIDKLMYDLLRESDSSRSEGKDVSYESQTLEYYIAKLLNMSRECVADLSVSSENISTPNMTDFDLKDTETKCLHQSSSGEELIRKSRLSRANHLEEVIKNWKIALGKDSKSEPEDVPDCAKPAEQEAVAEEKPPESMSIYSPKLRSRYEEITKKCSERISELSHMLDKVRKDKEKLLSSASGGSSLNLSKDGRDSEKDFDEDPKQEKDLTGFTSDKSSPVLESFFNKFEPDGLGRKDETISMAAVVDSRLQDPEDSVESWPDVMEELLKRKILTSPFKWSDGEYSSEPVTVNDTHLQPSSIETVIGNFRKEINKIKPFTLPDSFSQSNSPQKQRHESSDRHQELFSSPRISLRQPDRGRLSREETSMESINEALTSLGLNWAKSFLRKNEESKAVCSSSNSEGKSSDDEEGDYP